MVGEVIASMEMYNGGQAREFPDLGSGKVVLEVEITSLNRGVSFFSCDSWVLTFWFEETGMLP